MKNWRIWFVWAMIVIAGASVYLTLRSLNTPPPYRGTEINGDAPDFQLTDQNGSLIKLSDFRGKIVVLTFMDSKCKDTCPLTAAQLRRRLSRL